MHIDRFAIKPEVLGRDRNVDIDSSFLKPGFSGVWSLKYPNSIAPTPRSGPFSCYDSKTRNVYIGYGMDGNDKALSDVWKFDTVAELWARIPLKGQAVSGRTGARAIFHNGKIYVFGGYANPQYFVDFHCIDVKTGVVSMLVTTGEEPSARTSPAFFMNDDFLYVWGGFNGEWPTDLYEISLGTLKWRKYPQDVGGRIPPSGILYEGKYYSYGGSRCGTMLVIDMKKKIVEIQQTRGSEPLASAIGSGIIRVGKYMLFFGGRANTKWTLIYACDLDRLWWFVFYVVPDEETVSWDDGCVCELGMFMLPRVHSFALCYLEEERKVLSFMGAPFRDPPPVSSLALGEALGFLNLREDMQCMLECQ
jgi:hypothetical protein